MHISSGQSMTTLGSNRYLAARVGPAVVTRAAPVARREDGNASSSQALPREARNAAMARQAMASSNAAVSDLPDDLPPTTRKALGVYAQNQHMSRMDANADYLGALDEYA